MTLLGRVPVEYSMLLLVIPSTHEVTIIEVDKHSVRISSQYGSDRRILEDGATHSLGSTRILCEAHFSAYSSDVTGHETYGQSASAASE